MVSNVLTLLTKGREHFSSAEGGGRAGWTLQVLR